MIYVVDVWIGRWAPNYLIRGVVYREYFHRIPKDLRVRCLDITNAEADALVEKNLTLFEFPNPADKWIDNQIDRELAEFDWARIKSIFQSLSEVSK